jgi:hypothetical protein
MLFHWVNCHYLTKEPHGAESFLRANSSATSEATPHILWNPKIHYHVHYSSLLVRVFSHIKPAHVVLSLFSKICLTFVYAWVFQVVASGFPIKTLYAFPLSSIHARPDPPRFDHPSSV